MKNFFELIRKLFWLIIPEIDEKSFRYLGKTYKIGKICPLYIGDTVIIHPVPNHSLATKDYPAKISVKNIAWWTKRGTKTLLTLYVEGIDDNKDWKGFVLNNDYSFNRLEFVKRK